MSWFTIGFQGRHKGTGLTKPHRVILNAPNTPAAIERLQRGYTDITIGYVTRKGKMETKGLTRLGFVE